MPWMAAEDYLALVAVSDVVLDTPHYGGGANTVYDTVAVGTPLVTLPGELHRSRWGAAVNRRLELPELVAGSPQEFVAQAVRIASDRDYRRSLQQQILRAGAELFEDTAVIDEHNAYFAEAIGATRSS
jgi:predicted O-linked N-acetylglucosamine transferase (SPINDLY family)